MAKRALIVGINKYQKIKSLKGCENDANEMFRVLSRNEDERKNFDCQLMLSSKENITAATLRKNMKKLFKSEADVVLFYFSGHGYLDDSLGGYLATYEAQKNDVGIPMAELIWLANKARTSIKEVIIVLDCCNSGYLANENSAGQIAGLRKGLSILAASAQQEQAIERNERGVFTSIVVDALEGGAADITGKVTVAGIYNHVDQLLDAWSQRPIFKTHVSKLTPLRYCDAKIDLKTLRKITKYFPLATYKYQLSPNHDPDIHPKDAKLEKIYARLQKMNKLNLVKPSNEEHMFYAAKNNDTCELTPLGKFYWEMVKKDRI